MFDVSVELFVRQPWQAEREIELQETDVGGIGKPRAIESRIGLHAGFGISRVKKFRSPLGDARHHRHHQRMIQRLEQGGVDAMRLQLVRNAPEQLRQPFARIGNGFDLADDFALAELLPAFQCRLQERFARAEMPVEAALGYAKLTGQRFHGQRTHALLGDQVEGGVFPIFGGKARAFGFLTDIHARMVAEARRELWPGRRAASPEMADSGAG